MRPRSLPLALAAALAAPAGARCGPGPGTAGPMLRGDPQVFADEVQPVLGARCGSPTCHGDARRPFIVHSIGGLRLNAAATYDDVPLTVEEMERSFLSACGALEGAAAGYPEACPLLRRPLAATAGAFHGGGTVFMSREDGDYRTLRRWVVAALGEPP